MKWNEEMIIYGDLMGMGKKWSWHKLFQNLPWTSRKTFHINVGHCICFMKGFVYLNENTMCTWVSKNPFTSSVHISLVFQPLHTPKPVTAMKKDVNRKQGGASGRSNSTLSSREVEFQNWKRRKSYDPMKAAAEGKKKEAAKKATMSSSMTQSSIVPSETSPSR